MGYDKIDAMAQVQFIQYAKDGGTKKDGGTWEREKLVVRARVNGIERVIDVIGTKDMGAFPQGLKEGDKLLIGVGSLLNGMAVYAHSAIVQKN